MSNILLSYKRLIRLLLTFLFLVIVSVSRVYAVKTIFSDNFSSVDEETWEILNETMIPLQYPGEILFSNVDLRRSTFIQNIASYKGTNLSIEIKFRYKSSGFGSGIALNDQKAPIRSIAHPGPDNWTIFVWPYVGNSFRVISSICPESGSCMSDNILKVVDDVEFSDTHTLLINYINNKYYVYLNGELIGISTTTARAPKYSWFGNPMRASSDVIFSNFYLDSIKVDDLDLTSFPYYSQKNPDWGTDEYDSASEWAGEEKKGIARWGCALTSVAMILKNYDVKTPAGNDVTPDFLNTWLQQQDDGYIGPGWLNWLAVTRYARESYDAGKAPKKLEYARGSGIPNTLPSIINEGGHFVVAHASESTSLSISDPNNETRTEKLLTETFLSTNTFTQSMTDLSYMLFVKNQNLTYELRDNGGSLISLDWVTEYLNDDVGGNAAPTIATALIPKPVGGRYSLTVSGEGNEEVEFYLYDAGGRVKQIIEQVGSGSTILDINYNKVSSAESTVSERDVVAPSIPTILGFLNPNVPCGGYTNSKYTTIDWSDSTDNTGVARYDYQVNYPLPNESGRGVWNTSFTNSQYRGSLNEGIHYLKVRAVDLAGNKSEWSQECAITYDSIKPALASKTELSGWYNTSPTSFFRYTDTNLKDDYNDPSCTIITEGMGVTCSVTPSVCDKAGNCNTQTVTSNPIDLDMTAPNAPKVILALGWWNQVWAHWKSVADATSYEIWVGTKRNNLSKVATTTNLYWWSGWMNQGSYYVAIKSVDQAGNKSVMSSIWRVEVHKKPVFWHR